MESVWLVEGEMTTEELEIWKKLNELPEVKKVKGEWIKSDMVILRSHTIIDRLITVNGPEEGDIWVPHLYDPIRPERSLWGMMDWDAPYTPPLVDGREEFFIRPDLAIAKAIIERSK